MPRFKFQYFVPLLVSAVLLSASAFMEKAPAKETTQWLTLSEAETRAQQKGRPILIDLYTDWCGWCKVMDKKTYANPNVAAYINQHFYPVKVDAEGRDPIQWRKKKFLFDPGRKIHDFAIYLTEGNLSFPTTIILPADGSSPQAIPGYLEPADMELVLTYFGDGHYGRTPFASFQKNFRPSWK